MSKTLHKDFITYAEENGINLHHSDDYENWYDCWVDGYTTALRIGVEMIDKDEDVNKENNQCQP